MKTSKFTVEQIKAENERREIAAYNAIKDCISSHHKRFIGAVGDVWKVRRICTAKFIKGIDRPHSKVVEFLSIPTQTLKTLAGFYLRTSRNDPKRRIPLGPIIKRLEKEGIIRVIQGAKKSHRANVYMPGRAVLAELAAVQNTQATETSTDTAVSKYETTAGKKPGGHAKIMASSIRDFYNWVMDSKNADRVQVYRDSVAEYMIKKVDEMTPEVEKRITGRLEQLRIYI